MATRDDPSLMLSWFPQSPSASDSPEQAAEASPRQPSGNRGEEVRTPEQLPHDRILGALFAHGQDNHDAQTGVNGTLPTNTAVYDPFDGSFLGSTLAPDRNVQPEEEPTEYVNVKNEELWSHLSRVLELQNQISKMHLDMEEIGSNTGDPRPKGKGRAARSRAPSVSQVVNEEIEGDEGISVKRDEEAEKNKAREEQFSNLASQFRGKKEAINGIMNKLDALSKAVTEFHTLQAPRIDLPSSPQSLPDSSPVSFTDPWAQKQPPLTVPVRPHRAQTLVESPLSTSPPR